MHSLATAGHAPALPFHALDTPADEVERRFRLARERGQRYWLWPELPVERWRAAMDEVERVAAGLLAGGGPCRLDADGAAGADALGVAGLTSGMGPLLGWWLHTGALRAEPRTAAVLALHLEHGRRRAQVLEGALEAALRVLADAGVECTVVKGMHTARAFFPHPAARPMADTDLIVPPGRAADAVRALQAAGYERDGRVRRTRPFHDHFFPPGAPRAVRSLYVSHADNPHAVNLRDTLDRVVGGIGAVRLGEPGLGDLATWRVGSASARVLAGPLLAAYLAAHASLHPTNLQMVRLAELVLVIRAGLDPDALAALLRRTGAARYLYPALMLAERLVPGTLAPALAALLERETPAAVRRRVAALRPATAQRLVGGSWRDHFFLAGGPLEHARHAAFLLLPYSDPYRLRALWAGRVRRVARALGGR